MLLQTPLLTPRRRRLAYTIALTTDALQLLLGPMGWTGADQAIDLVAAVLTSVVLGFHPLLLPTFALEFLPIVDFLPTWTGCVALLIALRKRQQLVEPPPPGPGTVIDV